jgi:hypothetical protein
MPWETTLEQLIMVLQFFGFVGGWRNPGFLPVVALCSLDGSLAGVFDFLPVQAVNPVASA